MIQKPRLLIAALLTALVSAQSAQAETALLLPAAGDDALKTERQEALQVLSQALQAQAIRVLTYAEATATLGSTTLSECKTVDCAPALLRASGADVAAAVSVWSSTGEGPSTVFVTLVDRRSDRYPGKAAVSDSDLAGAVKDALLDARALQLLGPGPWLRVRGEPRGAQVLINGTQVGTTPYRGTIQSGRHTLQVRMAGYRAHAQTIDVAPSTSKQVDVEVKLVPKDGTVVAAAGEGAAAQPVGESKGNGGARPLVGPVVLGVAGVALIAIDSIALAGNGCGKYDTTPDRHCLERTEPQTGAAIVWGVAGIGAIVGAVLWYALGGEDQPTHEPSALHIDPRGLTLNGTF